MTPDVRVVRGEPDDVELAALVAGLAAGTAAAAHPHPTEHDAAAEAAAARRWRHAGSPLAPAAAHGPDAWRWSARG